MLSSPDLCIMSDLYIAGELASRATLQRREAGPGKLSRPHQKKMNTSALLRVFSARLLLFCVGI